MKMLTPKTHPSSPVNLKNEKKILKLKTET